MVRDGRVLGDALLGYYMKDVRREDEGCLRCDIVFGSFLF